MEQKETFMEAMRKLNEIQAARRVLTLAIYDKKVQEVKKRKLESIRSSLEAKLYSLPKKHKSSKEEVMNNIMKEYENAIDDAISAYNTQQFSLQRYLQESEIAQKYVIEEAIKAYTELKDKNNIPEEKKMEIFQNMQKKLNHDVVIDECEARIELCIDTAVNTLEELFEDSPKEIATIQKENFISRFLKIIKTFISKPNANDERMFDSTKEKLEQIRVKLSKKMNEVKYEIVGFDMQMQKIKAQL